VCELQWLTFLLRDLQVKHYSANLYCDNKVVRHIATNPVFHERTKHIEIDCHVVRERLQSGIFNLLPIRSSEQSADIFTKPLKKPVFDSVINKLGMTDFGHTT